MITESQFLAFEKARKNKDVKDVDLNAVIKRSGEVLLTRRDILFVKDNYEVLMGQYGGSL